MSDELVSTLQTQVTDLKDHLAQVKSTLEKKESAFEKKIAELNAEARDHRIKGKEQKDESDRLKVELAGIVAERDSWKSKAETTAPDLTKRIGELEGQIRTRAHKDAFAKAAGEAKVRPDAIDDAWTLSGWQANDDIIDEAALRGTLAKVVESRPYLMAPDNPGNAGNGTPPPAPQLPPMHGLNGGRGSLDLSSSILKVSQEQYSDPAWMHKNAHKMAQHRENGTLVIE